MREHGKQASEETFIRDNVHNTFRVMLILHQVTNLKDFKSICKKCIAQSDLLKLTNHLHVKMQAQKSLLGTVQRSKIIQTLGSAFKYT